MNIQQLIKEEANKQARAKRKQVITDTIIKNYAEHEHYNEILDRHMRACRHNRYNT